MQQTADQAHDRARSRRPTATSTCCGRAPDSDIRIEKPDEEERRLLEALDGERTLEQLREEFGDEAVDDADLPAAGAGGGRGRRRRRPGRARRSWQRFDRQLRYFSDIGSAALTPSECQRAAARGEGRGARRRRARRLVRPGRWPACGVGEMWLIDGDRVEASNLNRQILYTEADIGLLKVEAAAARLRAFNSGDAGARRRRGGSRARPRSPSSSPAPTSSSTPPTGPPHDIERWCNSACFEAGIPYITMSHFRQRHQLGALHQR